MIICKTKSFNSHTMKLAWIVSMICLFPLIGFSQTKKSLGKISWFLAGKNIQDLEKKKIEYSIDFLGTFKKRRNIIEIPFVSEWDAAAIDLLFVFDKKGNFLRASTLSKVVNPNEKIPAKFPSIDPRKKITAQEVIVDEIRFGAIWKAIDNYLPLSDAEEFQIFVAQTKPDNVHKVKIIIFEGWGFSKTVCVRPDYNDQGLKNRVRLYISLKGQVLRGDNNL